MALHLSSSDGSYLSRSSLVDINAAYTIGMWARWDSTSGTPYLISMSCGGPDQADSLYLSGGVLYLECFTYAVSTPTSTGWSPTTDTWYYIQIRRNSTTSCDAIVDGDVKATSTTNVGSRDPCDRARIGASHYGSGTFTGRVSSAKASSRALTIAESSAEMRSSMPVSAQALYGVWPFLAGATRAKDFSGKGHDWTEVNTPTDEDPPNVRYGKPQALLFVPVAASGPTYTMTVDAGSYALTGTGPTLLWHHRLSADAGSYAITGTDPALLWHHRVAVDPGSYALTGTSVTLLRGYGMVVDPGSYSISGTDPSLRWHHVMPVDPGVHAITGTDVTLTHSTGTYMMSVDPGVYTISGTSVSFRLNRPVITVGTWTGSPSLLAGQEWYVTLTGPSADAPKARITLRFR